MNYETNLFYLQKLDFFFTFMVQDALLGISIFLTFTYLYANTGIVQKSDCEL